MSVPTRFGIYETVRILLPGYFALGMTLVYLYLFFPDTFALIVNHSLFVVVFIVAGIFLGFVLYDLDFPKKRPFYRSSLKKAPSVHLHKRCKQCKKANQCDRQIKGIGTAIQRYFIILNGYIQADCRERIFYFGSIYHLFSNMKLVLGITTMAALGTFFVMADVSIITCTLKQYMLSKGIAHLISSYVLLAVLLFSIRRRNKGDRYWENILDFQVEWLKTHKETVDKVVCQCRGQPTSLVA